MGRPQPPRRIMLLRVLFGGATLVALGAAVLVPVTGCNPESRYELLSTVFDDVPPPGFVPPPRRPVRERRVVAVASTPTPVPTPGPTPTVDGPVVEAASRHGWDETLRVLPKDIVGGPDWIAAFDQGLIAPRTGLQPNSEAAPEVDLDLTLDPGVPKMKVIFPHRAHTRLLQCQNCHPEIFTMKHGTAKMTMGDIFAGQWCGRCHGKVAFDLTGCPRCHTEMGG